MTFGRNFSMIRIMKTKNFGCTFMILLLSTAAWAAPSTKENMYTKSRGFFTCTGGMNAPLLKQDCRELTMYRVSFGGTAVYESTCLDTNGTTYQMSCSSYVFEPEHVATSPIGKSSEP